MRKLIRYTHFAVAVAIALALVGCGSESLDPPPLDPEEAIAAAVAHSDRPADDLSDDTLRLPAEVLSFTGPRPGMKIFEIEAGRGYYTEMLSRIVGPEGSIVMHNPAVFESFAGEAIAARLKNNRLPNVRRAKSDFDALKAADGSMDIVTWFLGPHELYYAPAGVDNLGDERGAYGEVFRILKPGGYFVVLDHAARPGTPKSSGGETHRIDPAIVLDLAGAAGFELVDQSDLLRNNTDQYELSVFEAEVRRRTDRFLLKFRKPE